MILYFFAYYFINEELFIRGVEEIISSSLNLYPNKKTTVAISYLLINICKDIKIISEFKIIIKKR
jgi:hypothetical protein